CRLIAGYLVVTRVDGQHEATGAADVQESLVGEIAVEADPVTDAAGGAVTDEATSVPLALGPSGDGAEPGPPAVPLGVGEAVGGVAGADEVAQGKGVAADAGGGADQFGVVDDVAEAGELLDRQHPKGEQQPGGDAALLATEAVVEERNGD